MLLYKEKIGVVLSDSGFSKYLTVKDIKDILKNTYIAFDEQLFTKYIEKYQLSAVFSRNESQIKIDHSDLTQGKITNLRWTNRRAWRDVEEWDAWYVKRLYGRRWRTVKDIRSAIFNKNKKESYEYACLTDQKQFYLENYPKIVIEKETIDQI